MDREKAIKILTLFREEWDGHSKTPNAKALDMAIKALQEQKRKKGKWIYQNDDKVICSTCNTEAFHHGGEIDGEYKTFYYPTPFCPYCGAKLVIEAQPQVGGVETNTNFETTCSVMLVSSTERRKQK